MGDRRIFIKYLNFINKLKAISYLSDSGRSRSLMNDREHPEYSFDRMEMHF